MKWRKVICTKILSCWLVKICYVGNKSVTSWHFKIKQKNLHIHTPHTQIYIHTKQLYCQCSKQRSWWLITRHNYAQWTAHLFTLSHQEVFSSTGWRQGRLCHSPVSVVRLSMRALTYISNIFSDTTHPILMKLYRNDPAVAFFRISWKNLIPLKTLVAMATKLKNIENLRKSSYLKVRPRPTKLGM